MANNRKKFANYLFSDASTMFMHSYNFYKLNKVIYIQFIC